MSLEERKKEAFRRVAAMPQPTTDNLSGELSEERKKSDQEHIANMRKTDPSYPFSASKEDCRLCNIILKDAEVDLVQFKLVIKDKKTHEIRSSLVGPTIDGCPYCGRKLSISEKGIKFLE